MPIVLRHQAAGIAPDQENPRTKYGMAMVLQQQRSDQEMRQRAQDAQYDMQRMGAMGAMREMREPSIGEDDAMLEQEIRSGLYDPDTVRALRQDQRAMRQIMRDTNIDGTQRAQALGNLQSRMRMSRSTGKVQPMMQQMGPAALQTKPPMTEAEYFGDPVRYKDGRAAAMQQIEAANGVLNEDNIHAQMHNNYLAREKFLQNPGGFAAPQGQGQPAAQPPNAPAATPTGQPQASYTGGQPMFGASPVMAQGGMQQGGGQPYDQSMVPAVVDAMRPPVSAPSFGIALAPGHPDYKAPPTPTDRRDEKGYVIMSDGSKVDPRDDFAMSTGGRGQQAVMRLTHPDGSQIERRPDSMMNAEYLASNAPVGQGAYQPTGSYTSPEVFGAANVLANTAQSPLLANPAQPPQQQSSQYPVQAASEMQTQGQPAATQGANARTWTSSDGKFTTQGEFQGFAPNLSPDGSQIALIKRSDTGKVVSVPLDRLSKEDSMLLMTGGNRDTQYAVQNPQMSAGQAYFDPNNPVRQEMSAADQSIVNPQKETLGSQYKGRYGLGGADFGINPATGNHVTASVRPGGTMLEYDEPVGPPGTAMGGRKGSVTIMGGKKKPAPQRVGVELSPGETDTKAGINAAAPTRISRDDPKVKAAIAVVNDPKATREQQKSAADILDSAGFTEDELKKIVQAAPPSAGSYRPSSGDMWGNPNKQPSAKKESTWGTQKDVLDIPGRLIDDISAQATAIQRKVLGMPPLNDQEVADPSGELTETQRKNLRMQPKSKYARAKQESRDWQKWWSTQVPAFMSEGDQPSGTWTSADGKKTFEGSVVRISEPSEGTRYVSIKDKKGRTYTLDIKLLSESDQKKLEGMYKSKKANSPTGGK